MWRGGCVLHLGCTGQNRQQCACMLFLTVASSVIPGGHFLTSWTESWLSRAMTGFWFRLTWGTGMCISAKLTGTAGVMLPVPVSHFENHWFIDFYLLFKALILDVWLTAPRRLWWAILIFVSKLPAIFSLYTHIFRLHSII